MKLFDRVWNVKYHAEISVNGSINYLYVLCFVSIRSRYYFSTI